LLQVETRTDAGQPGPDDQDIDMFALRGCFHGLINAQDVLEINDKRKTPDHSGA
jgi:hypothetical protein